MECISLLYELLESNPYYVRILQFDEFILFKDTVEDFSFFEDCSSELHKSIKDLSLKCNQLNESLLNLRFVKYHRISFLSSQFPIVQHIKQI